MARKRRRRGLGNVAQSRDEHVAYFQSALERAERDLRNGHTQAAREDLKYADYQIDQIDWHDKTKIKGLGDGCRDSRGNFVPVPACMGRHVPRAAKRGKKQCPHGVNKRTGKCLKHPRRK